jgi:hypothetical protein
MQTQSEKKKKSQWFTNQNQEPESVVADVCALRKVVIIAPQR